MKCPDCPTTNIIRNQFEHFCPECDRVFNPNCIFCHTMMEPEGEYSLRWKCDICCLQLKQSEYLQSFEYARLHCYLDSFTYYVHISIDQKQSTITYFTPVVYGKGNNSGIIIELKYIPDINPHNIKDFIQRFINLKAFL